MKLWQQNKEIKKVNVNTSDSIETNINNEGFQANKNLQKKEEEEQDKELLEDVFNSQVINIDTMSREIAPYIAVAKKISNASEGTSPLMIEQCADGISKISLYRAKVITNYNLAKAKRKEVEARVSINEFPAWCLEKNQKNTDKMREYYCNQHRDVLKAKKNEAETEGLLSFLDSCYQLFIMSMSSIKSITYSYRSSDSTFGQYKTEE